MVLIKQFLTKTRPSDNTSFFRYTTNIESSELEICALISISNNAGVETSRFTKFVWDGFVDGFLQKEGSVIVRIQNALIGAEFKLRELIKHTDELEENGVVLDLSVLIFKEKKVFVGLSGDHKILMFKNKVIDISEMLTENKSRVGSMIMSEDDMIMLFHSEKEVEKGIKDEYEIEDYLTRVFDNEEAKGGAFVASLEEKEKEFLEEDIVSENIIEEDVNVENVVGFKEKIVPVLKKIFSFLSNTFLKLKDLIIQTCLNRRRGGSMKPIKIGGYRDRELKIRRFLILGLGVLVVFLIFFGIKSAFDSRDTRMISSEIEYLVEELGSELKKTEGADASEVIKITGGIKSELDEYIEELKEKGRYERVSEEDMEKFNDFFSKVVKTEDKVLKIIPVSQSNDRLSLFLDTKISFGSKSNPVNMAVTSPYYRNKGEYRYIVDQGERAIFEVNVQTSDFRKVGDPEGLLVKPKFVSFGNDRENPGLYVYDSEVGVLVAREDDSGKLNNFELVSGMSSRALGGDKITGFAVFGLNDSLNFLISSENKIVVSNRVGGGSYGLPGEYISNPSFEKSFDFFGDQYIYVLNTSSNGIQRFLPGTGASAPISLEGLSNDINIVAGYTGPTMDRAFLTFDSKSNRVIYFQKPIDVGENMRHPGSLLMVGQFEYRGNRGDVFNDVRGIVTEFEDKRMFVLDGMKIWEINIVLH